MSSRDTGGPNAETGQSAVDVETLIGLAVHASPVGMLVVDDRGVILFANREAERHFGFSVEHLAGLPVESLVPGPAALRHASLRQSFIERPESHRMGPGRYLLGRRQDGSEFPIEVGLNPVHVDARTFVLRLGRRHHGAAECRNRGAPWCRRSAGLRGAHRRYRVGVRQPPAGFPRRGHHRSPATHCRGARPRPRRRVAARGRQRRFLPRAALGPSRACR